MRKRRTSEGYAVPAVRGGLALCLLAAAAAYSVQLRDVVGGVAFAALLVLPRDFPLYVWIRQINTTVGAGVLGLMLLLPIPDYLLLSHDWTMAFAHLAMALAVWKFQHARLDGRDCRFLLSLSAILAILSTGGALDAFFAPLLAVYAVTAITMLTVLSLRLEEERILNLARVRSFERKEAPEVAGRKEAGRRAVAASLRHLSFWLIAGGFVIWWVTPHIISGVGGAFDFVLHGDRIEIEDPLPEFADEGPPPFDLPPDVTAPRPFGPRLERDEFVRRRESDQIALLARPKPGSSAFTRDLFVRGECYDVLAEDGRWIRARGSARTVFDGEDGTIDGVVAVLWRVPGVAVELEYLVPAGRNKTLYAAPMPVRYHLPRVLVDGVGNVQAESARAVPRRYTVVSSFHEPGPGAALADPGPEFLLVPEGLDREYIDGIVDTLTMDLVDPAARTMAVLDAVRRGFVRYEADERVVGAEKERQVCPPRFDVDGFLKDRKWGREIDFATAAAVLLRAAGIPCRLATGYAEGVWLEESEFFVFRTGTASAWVEVPFAGLGWIPFSTSLGAVDELPPEAVDEIFDLPEEERAEEAAAALEDAKKPGLFRRVVDAIDGFISRLVPGGAQSTTLGRMFAYLIVIVGSILFLWGVGRASRRAATLVTRRGGGGGGTGPRFPFYERLQQVLAALGYRRRPAETPLEFARAVIRSEGPELTEVEGLTRVFCDLRYGERTPSPKEAVQLSSRVAALEMLVNSRRREPVRPRGVSAMLVLLFALAGAVGAQTSVESAAAIEKLGSPLPTTRRLAREALVAGGQKVVPELLDVFDEPEAGRFDERIGRLIGDLDDDDFRVRERATRELVEIGSAARPALEEVLARGSPEARHRARGLLDGMEEPNPVELASRERAVVMRRGMALRVLALVAEGPDLEPIVMIGIDRPELRDEVVRSLAAIGLRHPADLLRLLERPRAEVGRLVARAICLWSIADRRPPLLRLLADPDPRVQRIARNGLVTTAVVEKTDRARLAFDANRLGLADKLAREALALCPGYGEAGRILADAISRRGRHGEALVLLGTLDLPTVDAHMLRARILYRKGDHKGALEALDAAWKAKPGFTKPLLTAARIHLERGREGVAASMSLIEKAITASRFDAEPWALSGFVRAVWMNQPDLARDDYVLALSLDPDNEEVRAALGRLESEPR